MRRTLLGLTALLVMSGTLRIEQTEAGRRRRCCNPCYYSKSWCAPQTTSLAPPTTCCAPPCNRAATTGFSDRGNNSVSLPDNPTTDQGNEAKAALPKPRQPAKITFAIHAGESAIQTLVWSRLKAEFEKRGFSCKLIRSPKTETKTPHQDRAKVMVEALKNVEGDIVLVGISNEGLFMPLVAAERPIRRIVMINAVVPTPGKSFQEAFDFEKVFATKFARRLAQRAPEMLEVCPLKELPKVEYVYICGEKDDAIRPEWEQRVAREYLHVEPVVVKGARHANIILWYAKEVADAATKGL
jgi:hypothetical protein